jgi:hypothetical protein
MNQDLRLGVATSVSFWFLASLAWSNRFPVYNVQARVILREFKGCLFTDSLRWPEKKAVDIFEEFVATASQFGYKAISEVAPVQRKALLADIGYALARIPYSQMQRIDGYDRFLHADKDGIAMENSLERLGVSPCYRNSSLIFVKSSG